MTPNDQALDKGNDHGTIKPKSKVIGVDIANLTQLNTELTDENKRLREALATAEDKLQEAEDKIEADLREDLYARIIAKSNYTRAELEERELEELQRLDADLARGVGAASTDKTGKFRPVSAAKDSVTHGTVPELFGKDRATILKELSEVS